MERRTYVAGCAGLIGTLAGCSGLLGGSGDSGDDADLGPAETVEAFYEAVFAGDGEEARSYFHEDAQVPLPTDAAIERAQQGGVELDGTTVEEEGESRAIVIATIGQESPTTDAGSATCDSNSVARTAPGASTISRSLAPDRPHRRCSGSR